MHEHSQCVVYAKNMCVTIAFCISGRVCLDVQTSGNMCVYVCGNGWPDGRLGDWRNVKYLLPYDKKKHLIQIMEMGLDLLGNSFWVGHWFVWVTALDYKSVESLFAIWTLW